MSLDLNFFSAAALSFAGGLSFTGVLGLDRFEVGFAGGLVIASSVADQLSGASLKSFSGP